MKARVSSLADCLYSPAWNMSTSADWYNNLAFHWTLKKDSMKSHTPEGVRPIVNRSVASHDATGR